MIGQRALLRTLLLSAALLALSAAPALASVRYASPSGSGPEPCNPAAACSLENAIGNAADGDQVVLAPGTYSVGSELKISQAIEVGGQPGAVPVLHLGGHQLVLANAGAVLHDVRAELTEGGVMAHALVVENGTVERAIATGGEFGGSCEVAAGLLRDFLCLGMLSVGPFEAGTTNVTLRNVTATPLLIGVSPGGHLVLDAANVIAHATQPGDSDLEVDVNTSASATATFTHSNYATVSTSFSAGKEFSFTAPGTNGNQTAPPQFVDAAAGDFRELATSPTVDAGLADPLIGSLAVGGEARSLPACIGGTPVPDIGAYEYVPTVACPKPSNEFKLGKLVRNRKRGTAKLTVWLPGPGTLALAGKGLVARPARAVAGAGKATLAIAARGRWRRKLVHAGSVKLAAKVTFTPTGGEAGIQTKPVKLLRARR